MQNENKSKNNMKKPFGLKNVELIVSDVDGVLTDGKILFDSKGEEMKSFYARDAFRIEVWLRAGKKMMWFTGRKSEGVIRRAKELEVDLVLKKDIQGDLFKYIKEKYSLTPEQVLYVGDDWSDLFYMNNVGVSVSPSNGSKENRDVASIVTETPGGQGVLAEVIELVMKAQSLWDKAVSAYLAKFIL